MLIENPMNTVLGFPVAECFHILGFAIAIGLTALVDFRLLGIGLRRQNPAELQRDTGVWILISLAISIFAGFALYSTDPDKYYLNWVFVAKMICLVLAIAFNYTLHRKAVQPETSTGWAKSVAVVSLVLWISVITGGMFISFLG